MIESLSSVEFQVTSPAWSRYSRISPAAPIPSAIPKEPQYGEPVIKKDSLFRVKSSSRDDFAPDCLLRFRRANMDAMGPIEPEAAVQLYLADKERESSDSTVRSHRSRLSHFLNWCSEEGIDNMNDLTARRAHEHRIWRRTDGDKDPGNVTMKTYQDTLRVFTRWCESVDAVPENLSEKILSPEIGKHENERDDMLAPDAGDDVLNHLQKYQYASREHVIHLLIWKCLLRRSGIRTLDRDDVITDTETPPCESVTALRQTRR